jgi:mannose-6-phosphate isomerase
MNDAIHPVRLPMNRPVPRPYRGGPEIERFRRLAPTGGDWAPEDFLASTVTTFASDRDGLTEIDGRLLRDLIADDPAGFLGAAHVERFGADTRLLCKLLHTGERLFVHAHPDAAFASQELGAPTGKTEAWIILSVDADAGSSAWLGFREDVEFDELVRWFDEQDSDEILGTMNEVPLHPGDVLFVPAGIPHAIGAGVLLLELQEPADLSVILEWAPFERLRREDGLLGLDVATALQSIDRGELAEGRLADLITTVPTDAAGGVLPAAALPFFRAESVAPVPDESTECEPQFAVVVAIGGHGTLSWDGGELALEAGDVVLVPYGAGRTRFSGDVRAIRCLPPDPAG